MKKEIAGRLLEIKAVSLSPKQPYTWSSGLKSPIYCDNRLTIAFPDIRKMIANSLVERIKEHFPGVECIAGTSTAGIPHAAWVSDILNLPMCYVRSKAKSHGVGKQIEGKVEVGQKVVIVEDLISTGASAITTAKSLREAGCVVLGIVSIFTYELENAAHNLEAEDLKLNSITDFTTLVDIAKEQGYIEKDDLESLLEWKNNPQEWGIINTR
jgi:orotate phosphoribosyltransferase